MATTTPRQGLPIPEETDTPDVPRDMQALALAIEKRLFGVYASTSARNTANPTPVDGQIAYHQDNNSCWIFQDGAWVAFPPAQKSITYGASVPSNSVGADGDVFLKI